MKRLRTLLDRPLDPAVGRAVLVLAGAVCVGFAAVVWLGAMGPDATISTPPATRSSLAQAPSGTGPAHRPAFEAGSRVAARTGPPQDPQDRPGTGAHRRADRELVSHRALQHVPWHRDGVTISLVGARDAKAVLEVRAATAGLARRGYRDFLRSSRDDGEAYLVRIVAGRRLARRASTRGGAVDHAVAPAVASRVAPAVARERPASADVPHETADPRARILPRSPRHDKVDR